MNERAYVELRGKLEHAVDRAVASFMGTIGIDYVLEPKAVLYPALAELLGVECECRTVECKGCEDVEEWIQGLMPYEEAE